MIPPPLICLFFLKTYSEAPKIATFTDQTQKKEVVIPRAFVPYQNWSADYKNKEICHLRIVRIDYLSGILVMLFNSFAAHTFAVLVLHYVFQFL